MARLSAQAAAWEPATRATLRRLGLAPGWRCVDLGCGPVGILRLLWRAVGSQGLVVGVDRDPRALWCALTSSGIPPNVRVVPADVRRTGLPSGSFDLVHARMVCQEAGLAPLLREMFRLVRPGGLVLLAEPGLEPWEIRPSPPGYDRLARRASRHFLRRRSARGPGLAARLQQAGLRQVGCRGVRLSLQGGHPYATMPLFALAGARQALLDAGARPAELRRLQTDLQRAAVDPLVRHRTFALWLAWGRKRRRA